MSDINISVSKKIKARDDAFIEKFCHHGHFIADGKKDVQNLTCSLDAEDYLVFLHQHDAQMWQEAFEAGRKFERQQLSAQQNQHGNNRNNTFAADRVEA